MRRRNLIAAALIAAAAGGTAATDAAAQAPTVTANPDNTTFTVPASVQVNQLVTFMNGGGLHNVHFVGEPTGTPNPADASIWSFTRGFPTPGQYVFYCDVHGSPTGGMRATLNVVAAPTTPAPTTPAPTTPTTPTPTTPATDSTAPRITRVRTSRNLRRAIVRFRLNEDATVTARLRRRGTTRTLKRVTRELDAGNRSVTLRRSLRAGARYQVVLRIEDAAGNVTNRTVNFTAPRP